MHDKFVRAKNNPGAVLNTDDSGLRAYKLRKARSADLNSMRDEVKELRGDVNRILGLLEKLVKDR